MLLGNVTSMHISVSSRIMIYPLLPPDFVKIFTHYNLDTLQVIFRGDTY